MTAEKRPMHLLLLLMSMGLHLKSKGFKSEVSREKGETADMDNLFQNLRFQNKGKTKMLLRTSAESSKGFPQDGNRYITGSFPALWSKYQIYVELLEK